MGVFVKGNLLNWSEIKDRLDVLKQWGIDQFIEIYNKNQKDHTITWGDEIEYIIIKNNKPCLIADKLLQQLSNKIFKPEYANYMIESISINPFSNLNDLILIEKDMNIRKSIIKNLLNNDEKIVNITAPWLLGTNNNYTNNEYSRSIYCSDNNIYPDQRFKGFTKNIRTRKGSHININMFTENNEKVHMDCMLFGMGCSCLQTTFQLENLKQARYIYDQFVVFAPIMMTLTASTPIMKGKLLNTDCRWSIISQSVDDRTLDEMKSIPKSRYSSSSFFISEGKNSLNDINFPIHKKSYDRLITNNIDHELAQHISHIFIRDPLLLYDSELKYDKNLTNHFDNLQSSNWESVRLKLPTSDTSKLYNYDENIGWRVELRTMEIQLTDFENASFVVFIVLLVHTILKYELNFYQLISQVDENMLKAEKINAVVNQQFLFNLGGNIELFTINNIIDFCLFWINKYLDENNIAQRKKIQKYLQFIKNRADGTEPTVANKIRHFVKSHNEYTNDCSISEKMMADFFEKSNDITDNILIR